MAKGFLSGMLWGSVASVVGLGVVSLQIAPVEPSWSTAGSAAQGVQSEPAVKPVMEPVMEPAPAPEPPAADVKDAAPDAPDVVTPEVAPEPVPTPEPVPAPEPAPTPEPAPEAPADEVPPTPDQPAEPVPDQADKAEADLPQSIPDLANTPKIKSAPVTPITDRAEGVKGVTTNRLPSIGAGAPDLAEDGSIDAVTASGVSLAIERNAERFQNPDARPLMAVLLADQGPGRAGLSGLENLPFPVSFIVDANAADAAQAIDFYRDAGAEVLLKPVLPAGATPKDAEVNFQSQKALTASAVGVFLDGQSGFQSNSPLAAQVADILVATGHGLVSQPQGLNTGHKTALKTGVAAGLVFRQFDDGADSAAIRRLLDNAAFKAGQENGVILMGRATPDTVQALVEWSLGNRVKSVAMAPVSAVLLGD